MPRVAVIIPTFNEVANIASVIDSVLRVEPLAQLFIIDDSSPDGTGEQVQRIAASDSRVTLLSRGSRMGLGAAYRLGFSQVRGKPYDAVVEMDGDRSHDPRELHRLVELVAQGCDVVLGSRFVPGGEAPGLTASRFALSRAAGVIARLVLGGGVQDWTTGFRAYSMRAAGLVAQRATRCDGFGFQLEALYEAMLADLTIREVPIRFGKRKQGKSKLTLSIIAEAALMLARLGLHVLARRARAAFQAIEPEGWSSQRRGPPTPLSPRSPTPPPRP